MNAFLIVDDHEMVRRALVRMLKAAFPDAATGEASTAVEALRLLEEQPWNLLILDVGLPGRNGLDVLDDVLRLRPNLPVLILTGLPDDAIAIRSFEKGARGYLCKDCSMAELGAAAQRLLAGGRYVTGALAEKLAASLADPTSAPDIRGRMFDVLLRLGQGDPVKAIAADMGLSIKTVGTYRTRLLERLGLKSDADIVRYCLIRGLAQF